MTLFDHELVVSFIDIAIFVPSGRATRVHADRPMSGFAYSVEPTATVYRFNSGKVLTCLPGQCIFLPKGSCYTVAYTDTDPAPTRSCETDTGTYAINFMFMSQSVTDEPFVMQIRGKERVLSCFTRAETAWRQKSTGFQEECFSALYQLLRQLKRESVEYSQLNRVIAKITPALQYIDTSYTSQPISTPHLAQLCGISEPHLRKLFNDAFSVSPSIYIRNLRLSYAKELLRTGEYSVTSVALLSGFNSTNYFAREFKKATGVSPSEYRP